MKGKRLARVILVLGATAVAGAAACGATHGAPLADHGDGGGSSHDAGAGVIEGGQCELEVAGLLCFLPDAGPSCSVPCSGFAGEEADASCSMPCAIAGCCTTDFLIVEVLSSTDEPVCTRYGTPSADCDDAGGIYCSNCGGYCCPPAYPMCSADCECNADYYMNCGSGSSGGGGGCSRCRF